MPKEEYENSLDDEAKFNMGIAILKRIDYLLYLVEDALINWDLRRAYHCLESIESEVDYKLKDKEKEEIENIKKLINFIFNAYQGIDDRERKDMIKTRSDLRKFLTDLDKRLRYYLNKYGFGMPKKSESSLF